MNVQPSTRVHPASWAANRHSAGWALLGTVWSSVFGSASFVFAADGEDEVAGVFALFGGLAALAALIALTTIGCQLAFGRDLPRPIKPRKQRSDAQIMALLALGTVLAITLVVATIVLIRN